MNESPAAVFPQKGARPTGRFQMTIYCHPTQGNRRAR
jgi:hypothetical protein